MNSADYLTRCAALRHRGLSAELVHDLQSAGAVPVLEWLEQASDADLALLSRLDGQRRTTAARLSLAAAAAPYVEAGRSFEARRCRRLCCPVVVPHDRTHPRCSQGPLLWDGDQA